MLGDQWTRCGGCVMLRVIHVELTSIYRMDGLFASIPALPHLGERNLGCVDNCIKLGACQQLN